jgi:hypothetical protein
LSRRFTDDDYARHLTELRHRIPSDDFTVIVEPPFVVIGDELPVVVRRRAQSTVRWSVAQLKQHFFDQDPESIIDIWMFRDEGSYAKHTQAIVGKEPETPFGFYSPEHHALLMNIQTGGGTLVHEIVHPFMHANFPACPAWFNEGLGALYEACGEREGRIHGGTNWRLPELQQAIREGSAPALEQVISTSDGEFYRADQGTNYAEARYLCYYLQHRKLLFRFYREFRATSSADPTGVHTLRRVLGVEDLRAFQKEWELFVLGLRFPNIEVLDAPPRLL